MIGNRESCCNFIRYFSAAMKLLAFGVLMCAFLAEAAEDPACPALFCQLDAKVGCYLTADQCRCFCVTDEEPCFYLRDKFSPECHAPDGLHCSAEFGSCKCRCGPPPPLNSH
ncbi:hypothetical protein V5799_023961 [Amblyomma americanum]|uniref:Secreted protein n=1 Tax=Amblyomma americanum TaxID=6943 RepID=A0AAQ4FHS5_AMBAM